MRPKISIVVPFFSGEENVTPLLAEIRAVCDALGQSYEAIFVNDGSKDATGRPLDEAAKGWSEAKPFHFLSNHGQAAALRSFPQFCHPSQVLGSRCAKFSQTQCRSLWESLIIDTISVPPCAGLSRL